MRMVAKLANVVLRLAVGGVFSYSGWNKLARPFQEFQFAIEQYRVFPGYLAKAIAIALP